MRNMRIKPQIDRARIILLGDFNPAIFRPEYLAQRGMIGETESDVPVKLHNQQELVFETVRFGIHVSLERFEIFSIANHFDHVRDFVVSCFGEFLPHTPAHSMGISRFVHFDAGSFEARDHVGSRLAPKNAWGEWGEKIENSRKLEDKRKRGGMTSITMDRRDLMFEEHNVHVRARVEPSIKMVESGIFVDVISHFDLLHGQVQNASSSAIVRVLKANWETSLERAASIFDRIMKLTEEYKK